MDVADSFLGRRTPITGGLGFIGPNLVHRLVELGAEVTLVDEIGVSNGQVFNPGGEDVLSLAQLTGKLVALDDNATYTNVLGWEPKTPIAERLELTLDYYRRHLARYV